MSYQPKTGAKCSCRRGQERDNCPNCEGTGLVIDFKAIRERTAANPELLEACQALVNAIDLGKLNIRKDFSLINAHACAMKAIYKATHEN